MSHQFLLSKSYFFHVFEQKMLMSEFCFAFSFNYCYYWSWIKGTANINFVLTMQTKLLHIISPPLCWGMQLSASNFEKGGLGNLKSSYHQHLHGVLTMLLVKKRLFNIKHDFEESISNVDMACFSQATNWCLVLWHFDSVKSLNSVRNLSWHSAVPRHIYVFSILIYLLSS